MLVLVFGGAALVFSLGLFLRFKTNVASRVGYAVAALGLLGLTVIGPMMVLDRVTLTKQSLVQRTGFWFSPTVKGFEFAGVERIVITPVRERRHSDNHWFIHQRGQVREIDPGDLWDHNADTIVPWLQQQGLQVEARP
jgi:hypothetical protein